MQALQERTRWGWVALAWLQVAALRGLSLRAPMLWALPEGDYRHVLHAHSDLALLGWLVDGLFALAWSCFGGNRRQGRFLFWTQQISLAGMLFSFPWQGYGAAFISFRRS